MGAPDLADRLQPVSDLFAETQDSTSLIALDITERRRAEAELRRLYVVGAQPSGTLGEPAASLAHEVKQPLGAISTYGQALLRWLDRPELDRARQRKLGQRIVDGIEMASQVVTLIKALASNAPPAMERVALEPGPPGIAGKRIRFQQLIVNLVINALQAMELLPL